MNGNMWDERFSEPEYFFGKEPNEFLVSMAEKIPMGRVLCIGEGEGKNAVYLAGLGYEVTAVDASSVGLEKSTALAAERGVEVRTIHADLAGFDVEPGAWSGVVALFCHLPPELRGDVHRRCAAGLTNGGAFLLEAFTERQLGNDTGGPKTAELLMSLAGLEDELQGLKFEVGREIDRESRHGPFPHGTAAVVQVLAYKSADVRAGENRSER